ncbi:hypothetical protein NU195Hw_g8828t1 [Hortaea werneckii]
MPLANNVFTFLVFGATGGTGKHFVAQALKNGHKVRALVRSPEKLENLSTTSLELRIGSMTNYEDIDQLTEGVTHVVLMVGDKKAQQESKINTAFIQRLVPSLRRNNVRRLLYQAGGLSRPYGESLTPVLWIIRNTIARGFDGQHCDNEAVMEYLATQASDIDWVVHRAGIGSDGPSKGVLQSSKANFSIATHMDCADFNYRTVLDPSMVHLACFSHYT